MTRFFVAPEQISEEKAEIFGEDVKHIAKVLRLQLGDKITILDGTGYQYKTEITDLAKDKVLVKVLEKIKSETEPPINVHLIQGLPKGDKFDLIVQKCTELGIKSLRPVNSERSVVKLDAKKAFVRVERWQKIAKEAAEQSARGLVPRVLELQDLKKVLEGLGDESLVLIPWEAEQSQSLREVLKQGVVYKDIYIVIGPEGGFSTAEIEGAKTTGAVPVTLGPRILRTETAGFAALTMILYELGDLGGR